VNTSGASVQGLACLPVRCIWGVDRVIPVSSHVTPAAGIVGRKWTAEQGTAFVSIPPCRSRLAPAGHPHRPCLHARQAMESWKGLSPTPYQEAKQRAADQLITRTRNDLVPGLSGISSVREVGTPRSLAPSWAAIRAATKPIRTAPCQACFADARSTHRIPKPSTASADSCFPGQGLETPCLQRLRLWPPRPAPIWASTPEALRDNCARYTNRSKRAL